MTKTLFLIATIALQASACTVYGPTPSTGVRPPFSSGVATTVILSSEDAALVRAHFAATNSQGRGRGNGRGRNGGLPPGIAKNLLRGKSVPPGIARQYLPQDLLIALPRAPAGLEYLVVAGKLLLVEAATQIVREVLLEAVLG
jgi:hypothetical protein